MDSTFGAIGIILKRFPVNENDVKAVVYTEKKGKLELIVRGAQKIGSKMAGHIEPLNLINLMIVNGKRYNYIGSTVCLDCFFNIKNDFDKINYSGEAIRFFDLVVKFDEPDKKIFYLLKDFLEAVSKINSDSKLLSIFFSFKLLILLGHGPELHHCLICRNKIKEEQNVFDFKQGGLICPNCLKRPGKNYQLTISSNCIKVLRLVKEVDLSKLRFKVDNKIKKELEKVIVQLKNYV
jgi:DNA repair protein RecO (recombination protein O)